MGGFETQSNGKPDAEFNSSGPSISVSLLGRLGYGNRGTLSFSSTAQTGTALLEDSNAAGTGAAHSIPNTSGTHRFWVRGSMRFQNVFPAATVVFSQFAYSDGTATMFKLLRKSGGTITVQTEPFAVDADSTLSGWLPTANVWYRVEVDVTITIVNVTSRQTTVNEVRIDGATVGGATQANSAVADVTPGNGTGGTIWGLGVYTPNGVWNPGNFDFDDMAINDSLGSSNNSWCDEGSVVLLLPTSDNSAGSWRAGSAASAVANGALFNAIDNIPPVGTATPDAATAAISNAVSGVTTPNGDFNMTTYVAAGAKGSDRVVAVQQIIWHAEDVATGTKTGTYAMVSNPAVAASAAFNFGNDGGAASTHPSSWIQLYAAPTDVVPATVRPGVAPVARVTKTDTGTRAADVDALWVMAEFQPTMPPMVRSPRVMRAATR